MIKGKKVKIVEKKKVNDIGKAVSKKVGSEVSKEVNVEDLKSVIASINKVTKKVSKKSVEQIVGKIDCFSTMLNKRLDDFVSLEAKFTETHFKTMLMAKINEMINSKGSTLTDNDLNTPNGYVGIREFPQQFVSGNPVVTCTHIYQTLGELKSHVNKYIFVLPVYFNQFKPVNE